MNWEKVIGHENLKKTLQKSVDKGRISHAQLFIGKEGAGALALAIAYASSIICDDKLDSCRQKINNFQHPDLHFSYPVSTTDSVKKDAKSGDFIKEWIEYIPHHLYGSVNDWLAFLGIEKKQGIINVHEAASVTEKLSLKSYEGGKRVWIIWLPEFMNIAASNKLLKIIEEPPKDTIFLLVTENPDMLLATIRSRCQEVNVPYASGEEITNYLSSRHEVTEEQAQLLISVHQNNLRLILANQQENPFEAYFVSWVRNAFLAKKKPAVLQDLIKWSEELATYNREMQKQFLIFCSEVFRQALLLSYQADDLNYLNLQTDGFKFQNFSKYIRGANIVDILKEIDEAAYHIERNGNAKLIFLDLSIKLTRQLHRKD